MPGQSVLDSMPFGSFPFTPPPRDTKIQLCPYVNYCWHQFLLDDRKIKTREIWDLTTIYKPKCGSYRVWIITKIHFKSPFPQMVVHAQVLKNTKCLSNVSQKFSSDSFHFLVSHSLLNPLQAAATPTRPLASGWTYQPPLCHLCDPFSVLILTFKQNSKQLTTFLLL